MLMTPNFIYLPSKIIIVSCLAYRCIIEVILDQNFSFVKYFKLVSKTAFFHLQTPENNQV